MKVGILVDGQAEYRGLPLLIPRITTSSTILKPLYCDMQPFAPPGYIAYVAMKRSHILVGKGASLIILLIDKETRPDCIPQISQEIESQFSSRLTSCYPSVRSSVIVKNATFENWLVADPDTFKLLTGMFNDWHSIYNAVTPDKADNIDAIQLLKHCCKKGHFDKVESAIAICDKLNPDQAAKNSRSFRRFLRIVNHPNYVAQSRNP
jgi:hypothetical protein